VTVALALFCLSAMAVSAQEAPAPTDINTATLNDLMKVNGIGKKMALRILEKRAELGSYKSMHQLKDVKGIGKKVFGKLVCAFFVPEEGRLPCEVTGKEAPGGAKVNLNTATAKELMTLPGVGKKMAEKILEHRKTAGWFKTPYDLDAIKGIGKKMMEKLLPRVEVKLNINEARSAQFEALGFANGDAIIEARQKAGGFKTVDDLAAVPGIDAKVFGEVKDLLVVAPEEKKEEKKAE
jgi:competence ComEA-like helix-hairpin-helix protein